MKKRRPSFKDLVIENKRELMKDEEEMNRIERKLEIKHSKKLIANK